MSRTHLSATKMEATSYSVNVGQVPLHQNAYTEDCILINFYHENVKSLTYTVHAPFNIATHNYLTVIFNKLNSKLFVCCVLQIWYVRPVGPLPTMARVNNPCQKWGP